MTSRPMTQNRPGFAIALKLVAVFLFMVMAAMIKIATESVPPGEAVFFRSLFAMPIILIWVLQRGELHKALIPKNFTGHVWRGLFGTSAMGLTFAGLGLLPLPEVTAIGYATPMFTVVLAALLLGERIRLFRISAVLLGLVGVMIVMYPRLTFGEDELSRAATLGALMVLIASMLRAVVQIHIRTLVKTEDTAAIVFYFSLTASVLSLATIPFGWVWPSTYVLALLIGAGLIGGVAQILVTSSYRFGGASMLAPFDYSSMIFAALIGYVLFAELPTREIILGSVLVIAGGFLIMWRERQLGLERGKARSLMDPKG
ncbi:MAG: DMT family transporter [Paracoccaceae bacterium]